MSVFGEGFDGLRNASQQFTVASEPEGLSRTIYVRHEGEKMPLDEFRERGLGQFHPPTTPEMLANPHSATIRQNAVIKP